MVQDPALGRALKESATGIVLVPWPWGVRDHVRAADCRPSRLTGDPQLDSADGFTTANSRRDHGTLAARQRVQKWAGDGAAERVVVDGEATVTWVFGGEMKDAVAITFGLLGTEMLAALLSWLIVVEAGCSGSSVAKQRPSYTRW